jgi:PAS domain-containing protein
MAQLRAKAERVRRRDPSNPTAFSDLADDALNLSFTLLQELAHTQLMLEQAEQRQRDDLTQRQHLFQHMPVACVSTDANGQIHDANELAGTLLNMSARHLRDRLLLHFAEDRSAFRDILARLAAGASQVSTSLRVRPRERAPIMMPALILPDVGSSSSTWLWFFGVTAHFGTIVESSFSEPGELLRKRSADSTI